MEERLLRLHSIITVNVHHVKISNLQLLVECMSKEKPQALRPVKPVQDG